MLKGVRGGDPVDRDALAEIIVKVSQLVSDFPEISELDLNPVFATEKGATAADVRAWPTADGMGVLAAEMPAEQRYTYSTIGLYRKGQRRPDRGRRPAVDAVGPGDQDGRRGHPARHGVAGVDGADRRRRRW